MIRLNIGNLNLDKEGGLGMQNNIPLSKDKSPTWLSVMWLWLGRPALYGVGSALCFYGIVGFFTLYIPIASPGYRPVSDEFINKLITHSFYSGILGASIT